MKRVLISGLLVVSLLAGCEKPAVPQSEPEKKQKKTPPPQPPPEDKYKKLDLSKFRKPKPEKPENGKKKPEQDQNKRNGGDNKRNGGDNKRNGGDNKRNGGDNKRNGGDNNRNGGGNKRNGGDNNRNGGGNGSEQLRNGNFSATDRQIWPHITAKIRQLIVGQQVKFTSLDRLKPGQKNYYRFSGTCEITDESGTPRRYRFSGVAFGNKHEARIDDLKFSEL